jgi:broad specificity phosphatase PhoE
VTVYLVRHGHKAVGDFPNPRLRLRDQPLSSLGRRQAVRLARWLRGRGITGIWVSEYQRTAQTARPLARRLGIEPVADVRLNEIDIGLLDGLSDDEIRTQFPEAWRASEDRSSDYRWPGGENGAEALERIAGFMREREAGNGCPPGGGNVLVVAHDGIIRLFVCRVLGIPVWRRFGMKIDPAGITELEWDAARRSWDLIRYNQVIG